MAQAKRYDGKSQREIYGDFITGLRDYLQKEDITSRLVFDGSMYKGTATKQSDFDNMFIKKDESITTRPLPGEPRFWYLYKDGSPVKREDRRDTFRAAIQNGLRSLGVASYIRIIKASVHVIVISYEKPGVPQFTIDVVYTLDIGDGKLYMAKTPPGTTVEHIWCETQATLLELETLSTIDQDNGVGKMVVRYIKSYKDRKPDLKPLQSYILDQVLMYLKDEYRDTMWWREDNIETIMKTFLVYLADALERGSLPTYHERRRNALELISRAQMTQLANRLKRLSRTPREVLHN